MFELIAEILICVFAVFGVYCLIRLVFDSMDEQCNSFEAILVDEKTDGKMLIGEIMTVRQRLGRMRRVVLIKKDGTELDSDTLKYAKETGIEIMNI